MPKSMQGALFAKHFLLVWFYPDLGFADLLPQPQHLISLQLDAVALIPFTAELINP